MDRQPLNRAADEARNDGRVRMQVACDQHEERLAENLYVGAVTWRRATTVNGKVGVKFHQLANMAGEYIPCSTLKSDCGITSPLRLFG